jgi:hypothetical protein
MDQDKPAPDSPVRISKKHYAHGKYRLYADTIEQHREVVERALFRAAIVGVWFEPDRFRASLRGDGLDDATIERYLATTDFSDDVYGSDRDTW